MPDYLKANSATAVLFYAPWCFYSQQTMPAWDVAAQKLSLHDPPVRLAKVNAHRWSVLADRYGINAFPMIKLFVDDTIFDYDRGGRSWPQIVKWANRHVDRDHVLKTTDDLDTFLHDNDLNVIALFQDGDNNTAFVHT